MNWRDYDGRKTCDGRNETVYVYNPNSGLLTWNTMGGIITLGVFDSLEKASEAVNVHNGGNR